MATFMTDTPPLTNYPQYDAKSNFRIDVQIPSWYNPPSVQESWASTSGNSSERGEYAPSSLQNASTSISSQAFIENQKIIAQRYHHHSLESDRRPTMNEQPSLSLNTSSASSIYDFGSLRPVPAINTSNYEPLHSQNPQTLSPLQTTSLEQIESTDPSPTDSVFFYNGLPREPKKPRKDLTTPVLQSQSQGPLTSPSLAFSTPSTSQPHPPRRRRQRSVYAELGSARAVYLEKNRQAASKCRNKQKRQQDELVEEARDVERLNKMLKAELEILQQGMRDLIELIGQHVKCGDTRLKTYVQREAHRWAVGEVGNPSLSVRIKDEEMGF